MNFLKKAIFFILMLAAAGITGQISIFAALNGATDLVPVVLLGCMIGGLFAYEAFRGKRPSIMSF